MTTAPVQAVLDKLPSATPAGPGKWKAFCPCHEADGNGHTPSLSVGVGDDGKVLLKCMAGCSTADVVQALGLTMADLFSDRFKTPAAHRPVPKASCAKPRAPTAYPYFCTAWADIERRVGGWAVGVWKYPRDALRVVRFDTPTKPGDKQKKTLRPFYKTSDGWLCADPPGVLPLYRSDELPDTGPILVCEGEKKVEAARSIDLAAVTSAHGCKSAHQSDWRPLAGRDVVILPDNDKPGEGYARDVATILTRLDPPARVRIVRLPGLAVGDDIADWLAADGPMDAKTGPECKGAIEALAAAEKPWTPTTEAETMNAKNESETEHGVFVRLSDVTPQPVRWLWPGRFARGKLSIIAGNAGLGKSCICLDLAARVSRGDGWPDCPLSTSEPGGVVLLSAEDDLADTIRPRLDAAGADVSRILALTTIKRFDPECGREVFESFNLAIHLPILESGIAQVENCCLVIIDVLSAYLGRVDSHNNSEVRALLAPLSDLAARHGVAVIGISHLNKGQGDALARVMGSVAFGAAPRAVYAVAKDVDDPSRRLFLPAKNNLAPDTSGLAYRLVPVAGGVPCVVWSPERVAVPADDALAPLDRQRGPEPENREEAQSWLVDFLTGGPRPAEECLTEAARVGITRSTLRRAKTAAGVVAEKQGYGGPWMWQLPGHEMPLKQAPIEGAHEGAQVPLF